jgi:hypothetical protein
MPRNPNISAALRTPQTLTLPLVEILRHTYGEEWVDWDPTTVYLELRDDYDVEVDTSVMDRISAAQVILGTGDFFQRTDAFINIANTLASGTPSFGLFDPVTVPEAAWALVEVSMMRELLPFSYNVRKLAKIMLNEAGYTDDYPAVFDVLVGDERPTAKNVAEAINTTMRDKESEGIEWFIDEMLTDIIYQFSKIPAIEPRLDAIIKEREWEGLTRDV